MKQKWIHILLIAAAVGLGICSWFLLPEVVTVQVGLDGQSTNTLPKLLAVAIPVGLSVAGSVMNLTAKEEKNKNGYILAAAGIGLMILSLLFNR